MKFTEWIDDEKYNKYLEICTKYANKCQSNVNEIFSAITDRFLLKNPEINSEEDFKAIFLTEMRWATSTELKKQLGIVNTGSSETILEESDTSLSKADEMVLKVLKSDLGELYKDRYLHNLGRIAICKKHKITYRILQTKLETIAKMLKEERIGKGGHDSKGIASFKNGKLVKMYHNIKAVEEDSFNRSSISKVVSDKLKTREHKGFSWYYVSELKIENN